MRALPLLAVSIALVGAAAVAALACSPTVRSSGTTVRLDVPASDGAVFGEVGDFTLTRADGEQVSLADLEGRPWVMASFFTRCLGPCPKLSEAMKEAAEELADTDVLFVSVSVDPEHDSPERLTAYAHLFEADPERWWFVTGDEPTLYKWYTQSFMQSVQKKDDPTGDHWITHSSRLVAVDRQGKVRGYYDHADELDGLIERMRWLAGR